MSVVLLCVYPLMVVPMLAPVEALFARRGGGIGGGDGGVRRWSCGVQWWSCSGKQRGDIAMKAVAACIVTSVTLATFFVSDLGVISVVAGAVTPHAHMHHMRTYHMHAPRPISE